MNVTVKERLYTAQELARMPSDARYELLQGELRPMAPPAGPEHGRVTYDLATEVGVFIRAHDLGQGFAAETGFLVARDPDTVLAADFAFVTKNRLPVSWGTGFPPLVPDLVLETRSPGDRQPEIDTKVGRWLAAGVRMVWELDPKTQMLLVYRPDTAPVRLCATDTLTGEPALPGFALPLASLFR